MTIDAILNQVHQRTGALARTTKNPDLATIAGEDDALLTGFIRHAGTEIARRTGRLQAVVDVDVTVGTVSYALPADFQKAILATYATDGANAAPLPQLDGADVLYASQTEGKPEAWGIFAENLVLNRTPADAGTLRLYYLVNSSLDASDALLAQLRAEFDQALVVYALGRWLELTEAAGYANTYLGQFEAIVSSSRKDESPDTATRKHRPLF